MFSNVNTNLSIGLPDGRHIRDATYNLLRRANLNIPVYGDIEERKYKTELALPSGEICNIIIDKPRDLLYSLVLGKVDIIITGSDYLDDFCLFHNRQLKSVFGLGCGLIESAHLGLNHLGYFGTQLGFMIKKDSFFNNLDELILNQEKIICYTEFPMIASKYLSQLSSYQRRFGYALPSIVSNFSIIEENPNVIIIYSHGATESKATVDNKVLIFELRLSGKTSEINKLKLLYDMKDPIFNLIYKRKDSVNNEKIKEFVTLIETTIKKYPDLYIISKK